MLKADFHMHFGDEGCHNAGYSGKQLIDHCHKLGYDVIAFTLHNKIGFTKSLFDYAKKKGILLISGIEATVEGCHVIILNVDKKDGRIRYFDDIRRLKKKKDIFVMAAHPFFPSKLCLKDKLIDNIDIFDAIEYCHFYTWLINFNGKAVKIAKKFNKPLIGTSDCHRLYQVGYTFSFINGKKNIKSIFNAVRENKIKLETKPFPLIKIIKVLLWMFYPK